jgi:phosphatidylglycerol:prolipoprotein diacylglycerol transferase
MFPTLGFIDMYSLMIALGVVMAFVYLEIYFRKKGESKKLTIDIEINALVSIGVGFLFAILFQNLYDFIENPSAYHWTWALTFFGGLIGGSLSFFLGYFLVLKKKYGPFLGRFAIIAPASITIAHGLGRIGCFCAGCCYGAETTSPLGMTFPGMDHKVWPTNLWEAIFLILLSLVLLFLALKKDCVYNFPIYMMAYGVWRFVIEYFRGDHRGDFIPGLTPSQFWALLLFIGGVVYLVLLLLKKKEQKSPANPPSMA